MPAAVLIAPRTWYAERKTAAGSSPKAGTLTTAQRIAAASGLAREVPRAGERLIGRQIKFRAQENLHPEEIWKRQDAVPDEISRLGL